MTVTAPLAFDPTVIRTATRTAVGSTVGSTVGPRVPHAPEGNALAAAGGGRVERSGRRLRHLEGTALVFGGVAAAWLLARQVRTVDLPLLVSQTQGRWAALAVLLIGASFVGAAWNLMGFSVVRLPLASTVLVQVAGGFVKVVSPAAVGCALVNARYLRRSGATRSEAVTSIGAAQFVQVFVTMLFLGGLAAMPGSPATSLHLNATVALGAAGAVLAVAGALWCGRRHPHVRAACEHVRGELASLRAHALHSPGRVVLGVAGSVVLVMSFALGLASSVRAYGGSVDLLTLTVVFLVGSAVGSIVPSPGGLGTVEAALVTGLVATGQSAEVAVPAVLWFRLLSVWVPVPLGWIAVHVLRRRALL